MKLNAKIINKNSTDALKTLSKARYASLNKNKVFP